MSERGGVGMVMIACAAIGAVTVVATMALGHAGAAHTASTATADYGERLMTRTTAWLGPDVTDPKMRYTRSRLACASCHLGAGAEPGALSLVDAVGHYPRISPRTGKRETIEDRINECMMRSMNGRALPPDGAEMTAMAAWLRFLAGRYAATGASERAAHDPPAFQAPDRAASPEAGENVFKKSCADCHGEDGAGLAATRRLVDGYLFPPLWGSNSFNDGAGMARILTAAAFIKAKMPLGRANLDDGDAFDVAAFILSKSRPHMANLERDYPDRSKKPVDAGYPPYADSFPLTQHRLGPFAPIEAYYQGSKK